VPAIPYRTPHQLAWPRLSGEPTDDCLGLAVLGTERHTCRQFVGKHRYGLCVRGRCDLSTLPDWNLNCNYGDRAARRRSRAAWEFAEESTPGRAEPGGSHRQSILAASFFFSPSRQPTAIIFSYCSSTTLAFAIHYRSGLPAKGATRSGFTSGAKQFKSLNKFRTARTTTTTTKTETEKEAKGGEKRRKGSREERLRQVE
jgi:hypothetical protein